MNLLVTGVAGIYGSPNPLIPVPRNPSFGPKKLRRSGLHTPVIPAPEPE